MISYLKRDLTRAAPEGASMLKVLIISLIGHTQQMVLLLRIGQSLVRLPFIGCFFRVLFEYIIRILFSSDISLLARIGPGLVFTHGHDIVIGADVEIGENARIFNGVTLGNKDLFSSSKGNQPKIGSDVIICTGAKVLGPVKVGNGVIVGANSVVFRDCPNNSIAVGIPAKVKKKDGI
ncbi:TPA: serine O-acetyltransferase [Vibrio vulnificus]|nr:serine acetyltransferase [Vibrio vulnificus]